MSKAKLCLISLSFDPIGDPKVLLSGFQLGARE